MIYIQHQQMREMKGTVYLAYETDTGPTDLILPNGPDNDSLSSYQVNKGLVKTPCIPITGVTNLYLCL